MITDAADFCRYSRSRFDMWFGTILAAVTGCFFCTFLGAYASASTNGINPNFFLVVTDLHHGPITLAAVFLVVLFGNWTINVLNLYTGGLSLANVFERLGGFWCTLIVGLLSIALSAAPSLVNGYLRYTTALGNLFAPIAGILLADYILIRRGQIDVPALFLRYFASPAIASPTGEDNLRKSTAFATSYWKSARLVRNYNCSRANGKSGALRPF